MTWFDTISKKKEKGMRKLEDALLAEGYKIVDYSNKRGAKHMKIKVKRLSEVDNPNAEVIQTTVSHTTAGGRFNPSMVVREIANKFAGRKRRGQGSFKLSNDKINTWQSILKIQPKDNPLSDEFEPPEIPPKRLASYLDTETFDIAQNQLETFLLHEFKVEEILSNFPIAYKFFEVYKSQRHFKMLRVEGDKWIYDNSYLALAFNTQFDKSIIDEHDFKSTAREIDLFLDAVLEFYLTIDSNYEERTEAIEVYASAIYDFLLQEYKGDARGKAVIEGTVDEAMNILQSFKGKVKPLEVVIRQTMEDIAEGDTEIDWETLSELYDTDIFSEDDEGDEGARRMFMNPEDYAESTTEEELRRRRNRG